MDLDYIGRIIFLLVCIFFISGFIVSIKQILAVESKPSTVLGFFYWLILLISIVVILFFDINKLHIIWLVLLMLVLTTNRYSFKYAFQIGTIIFNIVCFLLRKPNIVYDKDNFLKEK